MSAISGIWRVLVGLMGTVVTGFLFAVALPLAAMAIALYIVRAWPLTKRNH